MPIFLDGLRRERAWGGRAELFAVQAVRPAPDETVAATLDVRAALAALPARERTCVVLGHVDDLPVAEIAHALGVSEGAVKRYLSDGTRTLRSLLGDSVWIADDPDVETALITRHEGTRAR